MADDDFIDRRTRYATGVPGYANVAAPGGKYLGLGPSGAYLAHALFGQRWEEEAQRKQFEELKKVLGELRPRTETVQEPLLSQERTGRYHVGPSVGETAFPGGAPTPTPSPWGQGPLEYDISGPGYLPQPTPSRATFGDEALFPQGAARTMGPEALRPDEFQPTEVYGATPMPLQGGRYPYPPLSEMFTRRFEPSIEALPGGATAVSGLPPEIVTPPPAPVAFVPPEPEPTPAETYARREPIERRPVLTERGEEGRETEPVTRMRQVTREVPGKEFLDLLMQDPKTMIGLLKAFPGVLPLIQQEQERQQWNAVVQGAGAPGAAAPAVGVAPPVSTGTAASGAAGVPPTGAAPPAATPEEAQLAVATRRREQLQPIVDRINADPTGRVANSPNGKAYLDRYQKAVDDEHQAAAAVQTAAKGRVEIAKGTRETETAKREDKAREALERSLREGKEAPTPEEAPPEGGLPVSPRVAALKQRRRQLDRPLQKLLDNPEFLGTEAGKDVLAQMKVVSGMLTEAETAEKTTTERAQDDARTSLFTKFAEQERARGNEAGAQIYDAAALDKDSAEIVFKHREEARKSALAGSGAAVWKPWSEAFGDEVAGELAATPGLTPGTVNSAHIRTARDNVNREKTSRAKAGATTIGDIKWGPSEADDLSAQLVTVYNYDRIANLIRKNPEGWGGPGGIVARADALMAKAGWGDEERAKARTDIEQSGSMMRKAIFGTALSAHEAKFAEWVPTGKESGPLLLAKLEAVSKNIRRAIEYRVYIKQGGDPTKLPLMATPEGDVSLTEPAKKPAASPPPPPPTGKPAVGGRNPENQPGADGRTPRGQSARERLRL